jgi:hypothetical protein
MQDTSTATLTATTATAAAAGAADSAGVEQQQQEGECGVLLPVPVVSFLLPAMLSWTSSHSQHQQGWVQLLLDPSSGCLQALAAYTAQTAAAAAAAAAAAGDAGSNGSSGDSSSGGGDGVQLGSACQVLQQLLGSQSVVLFGQQASMQGPSTGRRLQSLQQGQREALGAVLQALCNWSGTWQQLLQQQQQALQGVQSSGLPGAVGAAEGVLMQLYSGGMQLPTLLPAAALAGQLVGLVQALEGGAVSSAAELLFWGCKVGWCVQLLVAYQQLQVEAAGAASWGITESLPAVQEAIPAVLQQMVQVWEVAELQEVWEVCLGTAAELLTEHGAGSVFGRVFAGAVGADGWLGDAMQGYRGGDGTEEVLLPGQGGGVEAAAAAAVVEGSMGMQLLLQAVGAAL